MTDVPRVARYAHDLGPLGHLRAELQRETAYGPFERQCAFAARLTVVLRVLANAPAEANDNGGGL